MAAATQKTPKAASAPTPKVRLVTLADRTPAKDRQPFRRTITKRDGSKYPRQFHRGEITVLSEEEFESLKADIANGVFNTIELDPELATALVRQLADQAAKDRIAALGGALMEVADQVLSAGRQPLYTIDRDGQLVLHAVEQGEPA